MLENFGVAPEGNGSMGFTIGVIGTSGPPGDIGGSAQLKIDA